jgi:uncharacterized protein with GYD domain
MPHYVILSRVSPGSFEDPHDFKRVAELVSGKIKGQCPAVRWKESYSTLGRYDSVDLVESDDPSQVERAAMIIRSLGRSETEVVPATP